MSGDWLFFHILLSKRGSCGSFDWLDAVNIGFVRIILRILSTISTEFTGALMSGNWFFLRER
jgi:hypothetical protein